MILVLIAVWPVIILVSAALLWLIIDIRYAYEHREPMPWVQGKRRATWKRSWEFNQRVAALRQMDSPGAAGDAEWLEAQMKLTKDQIN